MSGPAAVLCCRQLAVWAVFWLLVVFYAPIVAVIQAPVNMDNLRKVGSSKPQQLIGDIVCVVAHRPWQWLTLAVPQHLTQCQQPCCVAPVWCTKLPHSQMSVLITCITCTAKKVQLL